MFLTAIVYLCGVLVLLDHEHRGMMWCFTLGLGLDRSYMRKMNNGRMSIALCGAVVELSGPNIFFCVCISLQHLPIEKFVRQFLIITVYACS